MSMVFCRGCGKEIHMSAETCPHCGAPQKRVASKSVGLKGQTLAAVLAAFLGGLGVHRFYLGKIVSGILYIVFSWTGIPLLISFIETYLIAFASPKNWADKYNNGTIGAPVPGILRFILLLPALVMLVAFVFGIGMGVVLPAYKDYQARSQTSAAILSLTYCKTVLAEEFSIKGKFPSGNVYEICDVKSVPNGVSGMGRATGQTAVELTVFLKGGVLDGKEISLVGRADPSGEVSWNCVSGSVFKQYMPQSCTYDPDWRVSTKPYQTFEEYLNRANAPAAANTQPTPEAQAVIVESAENATQAPNDAPASAVAVVPAPTSTATPPAPSNSATESTPATWAPSFDCAKVTTGNERLICDSKELSELDVKLSVVYRQMMEKAADKDSLRNSQREWRKFKRDACSTAACIADSYKARIDEVAKY